MKNNKQAPMKQIKTQQPNAQQYNSRPKHGPRGQGRVIEKPKDFKGTIKKLLAYIKPYYAILIATLVLASCASICNIIAPSKLSDLTNEVMVSLTGIGINMKKVASIATLLICLYLGNMLFNYIQSYMMTTITQNISKKFRTNICAKINKVPLSYFDRRSYGDTLSRVTNDVDTIAQTLNQTTATLIQSCVLLIGVSIAMFVTKWQMALVVVASVPLGMAVMMFIIKRSQPLFIKQQRTLGEMNGQIEESFSGQSVIKVFNAEERKYNEFSAINKRLYTIGWRAQFLSGLMMPLMSFISNFGYVAVCVVGGILFKQDPLNMAGVIISFFVYIRLFQNPINQLGQAMNNLQLAAAASERVFEFLEETEQSDESSKTFKPQTVRGEVEFRNVKFGYSPDKVIIKDFSAKIRPGMKVAIVGPTGAGKTTMVNLIMRFYEVLDGDILIDGVSIKDMSRETVRDMFSMVLQDTWLFEGTIRDNIVYSKEGVTDEELERVAEAANIDYLIKGLPDGYNSILNEECNVSSGQKQLITIARAMIQNSPMMILDEATSNVDTRTEELIQEAMDRLTQGRTSFVIAHRLSTIKNADMILVMRDGNIIEQGNHEELISQNGFYASLYSSQFEKLSQ